MKEKIGIQKHIRIADNDITEQIGRVMEFPEYKSFNKVVNDALFYGLPVLCNKLFGETTLSEETALPSERKINRLEDEHFQTMIRLLKETVLNVTINKSILSSLFHGLEQVNRNFGIDNELYKDGLMGDTPDYLYDYETEGLMKMRR